MFFILSYHFIVSYQYVACYYFVARHCFVALSLLCCLVIALLPCHCFVARYCFVGCYCLLSPTISSPAAFAAKSRRAGRAPDSSSTEYSFVCPNAAGPFVCPFHQRATVLPPAYSGFARLPVLAREAIPLPHLSPTLPRSPRPGRPTRSAYSARTVARQTAEKAAAAGWPAAG